MSVAVPTTTSAADEPAPPDAPAATRRWRSHLFVALAALVLAGYVVSRLWQDPFEHAVAENVGDQAFFEWVLSYGVHLVQHGGDPFFTDLLNVPDGVNLAANTSITVYAILFVPLTMLAGPQITFLTILTLNLAGSAYAWYLFLGRWITASRAAAALAGLFCGFAPGFIAHANGHLNWTSGWIAPLVLWRLLKMRDPGRWLRNGLLLGLTLALGFSIAAEGLFFAAMAGGVFVIVWALSPVNRAEARAALPKFLAGLGVTAVVAGALLAYPLYMHFAGPQTFKGTGFNQRHYSEDLISFFSFADRSLASWAGLGNDYAANRTEEQSFFGLPLMVLILVSLLMLYRNGDDRRRATLRALMVVGGLFLLISLGPRLRIAGQETDLPLLYALLQHAPLFDAALPARYALVLVGVFGVILAMACEQAFSATRPRPLFTMGLVIALVPIFPIPLEYRHRSPEPRFIADGTWEKYVPDGGVMSALPFAINVAADGQRWQAYTMARGGKMFRIPDGYFLGPDIDGPEGKGRIGSIPRATDWLFLRAALYGYIAELDNADRATARADFQRWGVEALFLPDQITGPEGPLFRSAVELTARDLLGEPERVDDVLVWRIRPGVDPVDR
ncbi:DUF2079 domain-containing protein [Paractinoplanes lichenicola]|uniref:DUF2079 domain-containing protein n=1 Tax=Paractinoplanes lichenicola TaxID=2802976 RepID=A0ABS1VQE4_9ACTN|nr:DUF2079 domain-containing protein [Actinoplanes lichenicola]MBL7256440.1 DUF2079 domain-containing protein [Actinoplanes lichenicola]